MKAIFNCDGACRPNPGFGGYGIFGYTFQEAKRPKNTKHPLKDKFNFTHEGILTTKGTEPIEVVSILEFIRASNNPKTTNNENELKATLHVLGLVHERVEWTEVTIITDSEYVVKGINENLAKWEANGYKKVGGMPIAYTDDWVSINLYRKALAERGCKVIVKWVKGHSGDYGNDIADYYSVIGSNAARYQFENPTDEFRTDIYTSEMPYAEYKKSYTKDFVFHFKDLFFSSSPSTQDSNYCFVSANEDEAEIGKRDNTTIFLANHGYVPQFINRIKTFYRNLPRQYVTTCSMKLSKLENRDMLRMGEYVPVEYMLVPIARNNRMTYGLVDSASNTAGVFLQENSMDFPFIASVGKVQEVMSCPDLSSVPKLNVWDVTDKFVKDGKLALSNKDKFVDFTYLTEGQLVLTQRLMASVGADIPSYLALKKIEEEIERVEVILQGSNNNNLYTLFVRITTTNRQLYSLNVVNKYLAVATRPC